MLHFDLTSESEVRALRRLLRHPRLAYVHMAPPCGTASRARNIKLGKDDHGPPPLRSEVHPLGLPSVARDHPELVPRLEAANALYKFAADLAKELTDLGVCWSVENPSNSYMWWCPGFKEIAALAEVAFVHFQHCAFGGARPKWGALLHFPGGAFAPLEKICPGEGPDHRHEPWGRLRGGGFATAAETVYPAGLCTAIVDCVFAAVDLEAGKPLALLVARGGHDLKRHRPVRAAAARQARGGRGRPLLPEFKQVLSVGGAFRPADPRCRPGHSWREECVHGVAIPAGARTIRTFFAGEPGADVATRTSTSSASSSSSASFPSALPTRGQPGIYTKNPPPHGGPWAEVKDL